MWHRANHVRGSRKSFIILLNNCFSFCFIFRVEKCRLSIVFISSLISFTPPEDTFSKTLFEEGFFCVFQLFAVFKCHLFIISHIIDFQDTSNTSNNSNICFSNFQTFRRTSNWPYVSCHLNVSRDFRPKIGQIRA